MRNRFLTYLAHTDLRWVSEQEREELANFAEQSLPALARLAGLQCQDGELYSHTDIALWQDLNSDPLPQQSQADKNNMAKTMTALKYWLGFLNSKYLSMSRMEFDKQLAAERKRAARALRARQSQADNEAASAEAEGKIMERLSNERQRSRKLRNRVTQIFGTVCVVCHCDMADIYGPGAEGCVEVHHLNPISNFDGEHEITDDDIRDDVNGLRPLCPNCHTMIHKLGENWKTPMPLNDFIQLYNDING